MIFSSFGNSPQDFSRVARVIDQIAKDSSELFLVQKGNTKYVFRYAKEVDFIPHDEIIAAMKKADIVVLQGGWGCISEALKFHKRIVSVPRRCPQEVQHDQSELVKKLEQMGCVIGVYDENELAAKIELARKYEFKELRRGNALPFIEAKLKEWGL